MDNPCPSCSQPNMLLDPLDRWQCTHCQGTTPPQAPDIPAARAYWDALVARMKAAQRQGRGGYRPGSGRKALRGPTQVMRIPTAYRAAIEALMNHLDDCAHLGRHYAASTSAPLRFHSLQGKLQTLTVQVAPVDFTARPITSAEEAPEAP